MEEAAQDEVEERGFERARLKAHAASIEDIDARLLAHRKIDRKRNSAAPLIAA